MLYIKITLSFYLWIRFLDGYAKQGVTFWGITAQNEPTDGNTPK